MDIFVCKEMISPLKSNIHRNMMSSCIKMEFDSNTKINADIEIVTINKYY